MYTAVSCAPGLLREMLERERFHGRAAAKAIGNEEEAENEDRLVPWTEYVPRHGRAPEGNEKKGYTRKRHTNVS